jgi:hypothetical protein
MLLNNQVTGQIDIRLGDRVSAPERRDGVVLLELTAPKAGQLSRVRVVLPDDHQTILERLTCLLEPEFEVAGTAGDGQSLIESYFTT